MRVFVTVGSMLPFDRLIRAVADWAASHPDVTVVAQVGQGGYGPENIIHHAMLTPQQYRENCGAADVIVSHLGMGTVITAAELGKPLVALPRRPELAEVTSDHQMATAGWLRDRPGVIVVDHESELGAAILRADASGAAVADFGQASRDRLIACLRNFLVADVRR